MLFVDRDVLRVAIYSARRGEDHRLAAVLRHGFAELDCACDVVVVVDHRLFNGFVDVFTASEMNDGIKSVGRRVDKKVRSKVFAVASSRQYFQI